MSDHVSGGMMGAEGFGSNSSEKGGGDSTMGKLSGKLGSAKDFMSQAMKSNVPKDRRNILDIGDEKLKLKEMKKVMEEMIAGEDLSALFPVIVKNVACKSVELKKLTYQFVVRYAEELPDIALLSISSFQKGLKDPNQLIRASALRVLSSIRVEVIIPIVEIAISTAAVDMSPYVRKCAAHAIPKLADLSPESTDQLLEVLEKLLHDRTSLVLGSVVMAFEEICPDRFSIVHKHFRKLCNTLIDIDEWGQVAVLQMLTRYARANFRDPNGAEDASGVGNGGGGGTSVEDFYGDAGGDGSDDTDDEDSGEGKAGKYMMDPDHRLLLRSAVPLLQSRNNAVIMAVVHLYRYCAPANELGLVAKPLVRMLRSHREVQQVALTILATVCGDPKLRPTFYVYLKNFFVRSDDPTFIRTLKLEIMCCLANETNVGLVLREFQHYVSDTNKAFVCQTVQTIGRVATQVEAVTEQCLQGLMSLLQEEDEGVVGESVVVIKKLLQLNPEENRDTIVTLAKLAMKIHVPAARASIVWLLGEYSGHVPKIAPDVLRQLAKTFPDEEDIVKLQIMNLSAKLYLTNPKQTKKLFAYVSQLARYDTNFDIRDRARLIKGVIMTKDTKLHKHSKHLFLSKKPAPALVSHFKANERYALGSLSHILDRKIDGYKDLGEFPLEIDEANRELRNFVQKEYKGISSSDTPAGGSTGLFAEESEGGNFYSDDDSDSDDSDDSSALSTSDSDDSTETREKKMRKKKEKTTKASKGGDDSDSDSDSDGSDDDPTTESDASSVSVYGGSTTEDSSSSDSDSDSDSDSSSDSGSDSDSDSDSNSDSDAKPKVSTLAMMDDDEEEKKDDEVTGDAAAAAPAAEGEAAADEPAAEGGDTTAAAAAPDAAVEPAAEVEAAADEPTAEIESEAATPAADSEDAAPAVVEADAAPAVEEEVATAADGDAAAPAAEEEPAAAAAEEEEPAPAEADAEPAAEEAAAEEPAE